MFADQMESSMSVHSFTLSTLLVAALALPLAAQAADEAPAPGVAQDSGVAALIATGEALLAAGESDAALATLDQAVAADPQSSIARTRLGGARLMRQEYSAAIEDFRGALAVDPNNADAFVGMAVAYLHSGDYTLARAALEEARRLAPEKGAQIDQVLVYLDRRAGEAIAPAAH